MAAEWYIPVCERCSATVSAHARWRGGDGKCLPGSSSWQTFVACLLLAKGPAMRRGVKACVVLGRMMEVSRKKMRWPALGECHARILRSTWLKIRRRLVFTQHHHYITLPPATTII